MRYKKHLLVIRLSAMGDVAMTVPVLAALQDQYPELKITFLTRSFFKPIFSQLTNVTVYEADVAGRHKGISGLYTLYKELVALDIDAVADLHHVLRSTLLKFFFSMHPIPVFQIDKGRNEKKKLTSLKDKKIVQLKTTHQRYADVFEKLGFPISLENVSLLSKTPLAVATQHKIGTGGEKWIGIAPFAAFSGKMYPLELMEQVVKTLNNTNKYKIILFGGGLQEKNILEVWQSTYKNCINMTHQVSFEEELAVISHVKLMVAMDSGNAHLAAMYGVPTITLWGVTHPYAGFYPFQQESTHALLSDRKKFPFIPTSVYGNKYPEGYAQVMKTISPAAVFKKIEEVLASF